MLIPTSILLALVLRGSKVMPLTDLTFLLFFTMHAASVNEGDVVRSLITATILVIFAIYAGSFTAPVTNELASASGGLRSRVPRSRTLPTASVHTAWCQQS